MIPSLLVIASLCLSAGDYSVAGISSDQITMSVNVWGEVRNPGLHLIPWDSDLRDALSAAGGPSAQADLSNIRIVTTDLEIEYNMSDFLSGHGAPIPPMEPDATVFVGTSSYEWWKDVVDFSYKILIMANVIWVMSR
jgi:hypothetical protein